MCTGTPAALHVWLQCPTVITRALYCEFVLLTALAALHVFGAEPLDLAGFIIGTELHPKRAGTHDSQSWSHGAVVTAASILQRAQILLYTECGTTLKDTGYTLYTPFYKHYNNSA